MSLSHFAFYAAPTQSGQSPARGASPDSANPDARSDQFVAVSGPDTEQVSAHAMVVVAYGLFWFLAFAFVYQTYRRQIRLSARIAEIEKKLPKDPTVS